MKQLLILSAAVILTVTVSAQADLASVKNDDANTNRQESLIKKEKKAERMELRSLKGNEASYQAKQAFISDFGNVPVTKWESTDNHLFDRATFIKDGKEMRAYYDFDSKLVGTVQDKTFADLPAKAQENINKYFKEYTPGDVIFFDDNEQNETDMVLSGNQFDDVDSYFVELQKGNKKIVVHVTLNGEVGYFAQL